MYTSLALAKIIGLYCVLVGLAMLLKPARCKKMVQDCAQFPAILDVAGVFTLILGLIMIVIHNVWVMAWPVLVTIVAWLVVIKGVVVLFMPEAVVDLGRKMSSANCCHVVAAIVTLVIGIIFCLFGFFMW